MMAVLSGYIHCNFGKDKSALLVVVCRGVSCNATSAGTQGSIHEVEVWYHGRSSGRIIGQDCVVPGNASAIMAWYDGPPLKAALLILLFSADCHSLCNRIPSAGELHGPSDCGLPPR
jgi:hypothetical protein